MTNQLAGRKVAITGGARGIGRATAEAFLAEGATVVLGDIDVNLVEQTAAELSKSSGGHATGLGLDVTDPDSFEKFIATAEQDLGGLDVLINNAGIMPTGSFLDEPLAVADRQFAINVRGVIIGSKLAGKRFVAQGSGHIVNIASVAGLIGSPGVATYCATKHAVVGLGSAIYQELEPQGVAVTTICPSFVNTELIAGLAPNWLTKQIAFVEPTDIADAIIDSVVKKYSGQRVVPTTSGLAARMLAPLPERLRNQVSHILGAHSVIGDADQTKRAAYLERAEGAEK
ncbi:SDR family oxidoreductase [Nocardia sp. NPDC057663]|uniref:SDR family oxidoreductase n=1 Tax=Nocardia sp. NPDC057663 TaxID=3346201 RepID=UPI00366D0ECC